MKILLTGASGFLGGRVARRLSDAGHRVRGFVRDPQRWDERPEGSEVAVGDVTDPDAIRQAAQECDAVVHAAALVKNWVRDPRQFDRINVSGLGNVIAACRQTAAWLVYVSSFVALGPTDGRIFDESTPRATEEFHNDYERTKWLADQMARHVDSADLDLVRVYPGVIFGAGALTDGNHVVKLLLQHAAGQLPGMLGSGDLRQCFAYVDDVADGVLRALESGKSGEGYILGGENRTAVELFEVFQQAAGIAPPARKIPFAVASWIGKLQRWRAVLTGIEPELTDEVVGIYRHEWAFSSSKAERELGYRVTPFELAIEQTVNWLRRQGRL